MCKRARLVSLLLVAVFALGGCNKQPAQPAPIGGVPPGPAALDAATVAGAVVGNVAKVGKTAAGAVGAPVIILEENHAQRLGQLQLAVVLARLHEQYGLRDVVLEGYLDGGPEIGLGWWRDATEPMTDTQRQRVAVRLLAEGEISAVECAALALGDITVARGEMPQEYGRPLNDEAYAAPTSCLLKAALETLSPDESARAAELQGAAEDLEGDARAEKMGELIEYIISTDPWTEEMQGKLGELDPANVFGEGGFLDVLRQIRDGVKERGISLESEETQGLNDMIAFYEGRGRADDTMAGRAATVAKAGTSPVIVVNVGQAHTPGVCRALEVAGVGYAVVAPACLDEEAGAAELSMDQFALKGELKSVYTEGLASLLAPAFSEPAPNGRKPRPVLPEQWFQAKSELYALTDRVTRDLLGPPVLPGGGEPPFGYAPDDLTGRWVQIDPSRIEIVPLHDDTGEGRAVCFPVTLNPEDPLRRRDIWAKAWLGEEATSVDEEESLEHMLMQAIESLKGEDGTPDKVEDADGCIQISLDTVVGFAKTQPAARQTAPRV